MISFLTNRTQEELEPCDSVHLLTFILPPNLKSHVNNFINLQNLIWLWNLSLETKILDKFSDLMSHKE